MKYFIPVMILFSSLVWSLCSIAQGFRVERDSASKIYEPKYGIKDSNNNWVLKPEYNEIINDNGTFIIYNYSRTSEEKWIGFFSSKGNYTGQIYNSYKNSSRSSKVQYYIVEVFKNIDSLYLGIIDKEGIERIPPGKYNLKEINQNGYIIFSVGGKRVKSRNGYVIIDEKFGIVNYDGTIMLESEYDAIISYCNTYNTFESECDFYLINNGGKWDLNSKLSNPEISGGKWGVVNSKGKIVVPIKYENIKLYTDPAYPYIFKVNKGGKERIYKMGYKHNGRKAIANYERAVKGGYYGYADTSGNEIIPTVFTWISDYDYFYSKALFVAKDPAPFTHIYDRPQKLAFALADLKGNVLTPFKYSYSYSIHDSIIIASLISKSTRDSRLSGYLRIDGKEITPFNMQFYTGYYRINGLTIYSQLDSEGHIFYNFLRPDYSAFDLSFDELRYGWAGFYARRGKLWALLDSSGKQITPFKYEKLTGWNRDTILVTIKGKKNLLDANGKELFSKWIEEESIITKNLSVIKKVNRKYGILTFTGDTLVPFKYDHIIELENVWEYIPAKWGSKKIMSYNPYQYDLAYNVSIGGKRRGGKVKGGKWGFINPNSEYVTVPAIYDKLDAVNMRIIEFSPGGKEFMKKEMGFHFTKGKETGFIDILNRPLYHDTIRGIYYYINQHSP